MATAQSKVRNKAKMSSYCTCPEEPLHHVDTKDLAKTLQIKDLASMQATLSPSTCLKLRSLAKQNQLNDIVAHCDQFMDEKLSEMLNLEDVLNLPRIQVNVKVSSRDFELRSDFSVIDSIIPKVVTNLEQNASSHLEEKVIEMFMDGDLVTNTKTSTKNLSPEKIEVPVRTSRKMVPFPARKLILDDSLEENCEDEFADKLFWKILSSHKLSELNAVCVVDNFCSLVLIAVALIPPTRNSHGPSVSPTTGLPFTCGSGFISPMPVARSGFGVVSTEDSLMAVGGFNREGCISKTECYNFTQNSWEEANSLSMPRARFGIAQLDDTIFAIGGSDGKRELSSIEIFDSISRKWVLQDSKLLTPRSCFGATSLDGLVYVIGGLCYSKILNACEVYSPSLKQWEALPSMCTRRRDLAVASSHGKLYAFGGQTSGWSCLASVECFDPATREWSQAPPMRTPRRNAVAVTFEDKIYVIGGYNGSSAVKHVEIFDPLEWSWSQGEPLNVNRSYPAATVVDNSLFVAGGYGHSTFLNSIERFDMSTSKWTPFV